MIAETEIRFIRASWEQLVVDSQSIREQTVPLELHERLFFIQAVGRNLGPTGYSKYVSSWA